MTDRRNNRYWISRRFLVSSCLQSAVQLQNSFLANFTVRVYWSTNNHWNFSVFFWYLWNYWHFSKVSIKLGVVTVGSTNSTLSFVVKPCSLLFIYQCSRFTTPKTQFHSHILSIPLRGQKRELLFVLWVNNNIIGKQKNFCNITRHTEKVLEPTVI